MILPIHCEEEPRSLSLFDNPWVIACQELVAMPGRTQLINHPENCLHPAAEKTWACTENLLFTKTCCSKNAGENAHGKTELNSFEIFHGNLKEDILEKGNKNKRSALQKIWRQTQKLWNSKIAAAGISLCFVVKTNACNCCFEGFGNSLG